MRKIRENLIVSGFMALAALAIVAIAFPVKTLAAKGYYGGTPTANYEPRYVEYHYSQPAENEVRVRTVYVEKPVYIERGAVLGASTDNTNSYKETKEEFKDLTANTVYGGNSFYPSGILQWVGLAILILIIIILGRKLFRSEEKYQATPLKHS